MTLHEYLGTSGISDADFAGRLGCSEGAVKKWRYRERMPRADQLRRIMEATEGAVTANDFMAPPLSPERAGAQAAAE
jgi:transcriptional regulator with XRE-family HTH domain